MTHDDAPAAGAIRALAPAKVNLRLKVLAREVSGYHQIETLFCAIGLADTLEVTRVGDTIGLEVTGAELGRPEENLVYRAAAAFFHTARIHPGVRMRLEKAIPAGAGLGGGSSDAATTLLALNELYGNPLSPAAIFRIGARLGSDIPFFLSGAARAIAWGRGERLLPLPPLAPAPMVLVLPEFSISTAGAYQALARAREGREQVPQPAIIDTDRLGSWVDMAKIAENDFEAHTFERFPILRKIKVSLQDAGATIALLSGSGSAVFAIFPDQETRDKAIPLLNVGVPGSRVIVTTTAPIG